jgi:cytochrome P450
LVAYNYTILKVVSFRAFGYDFNSMEDTSFLDQYISIMVALASPPYIILPILEQIFPRPAVHRKIASVKALFESLIAQARAERDELKSNVDVNGIPTTDNQPFNGKLGRGHSRGMLDLLVAHDSLSDDEIRDNLITFFMAGHDTTAGALMSSLYYLAVHPAAQSRARAEAVACLGNATQAGDLKSLSVADLQGIPYILACLREALRLNPPAVSGVPRACAFDSCLGEYFIPARTTLLVNIWAIQHNEHEWEAPSEFRPERWIVNTSDEDVHAGDDSDKWNEIPRTEAMGKMPDKFS